MFTLMELSCGRLVVVDMYCAYAALARSGTGTAFGSTTTGVATTRRRSSPLDKLEADLHVCSTLQLEI